MRKLSKEQIQKAIANDAWDLGNQVLYDFCAKHPHHETKQEIVAKVWMIGRTYAAALERRKNKSWESDGDLFYEDKAFPEIKKSGIDNWIGSLKTTTGLNIEIAQRAVSVHYELTDLFKNISGLEKRSLASKYLHFHLPDIFFIYDSRAVKAIREITPPKLDEWHLSPGKQDFEYLKFFRKCLWLCDEVRSLGQEPTPRNIDKILLAVADKRI